MDWRKRGFHVERQEGGGSGGSGGRCFALNVDLLSSPGLGWLCGRNPVRGHTTIHSY